MHSYVHRTFCFDGCSAFTSGKATMSGWCIYFGRSLHLLREPVQTRFGNSGCLKAVHYFILGNKCSCLCLVLGIKDEYVMPSGEFMWPIAAGAALHPSGQPEIAAVTGINRSHEQSTSKWNYHKAPSTVFACILFLWWNIVETAFRNQHRGPSQYA